jgi:hypothetical protein
MSAFTPIAFKHWQRSETTLCARNRHMHRSKTASLFDHLVGAQEEISTDRKSECSRCFEIDDKLEFGQSASRQASRPSKSSRRKWRLAGTDREGSGHMK